MRILDVNALLEQLKPGDEVFVAGCAGEPVLLLEALTATPSAAAGVRFTGVHIPGVNRFAYADLTPTTRQRSIFLSPALRPAFRSGRVEYLPISYSAITALLEQTQFDWVIFQGASCGAGINLSVAADFTQAASVQAKHILGVCNANLPITSAANIEDSRLIRLACESPVLLYDAGSLSPAFVKLGQIIAAHIENGSTLQFGLGKLQKAVLDALHAHQNLRVHSGMISDPILALEQSGALAANKLPAICTGVALGSKALYERASDFAFASFMPVSYTHSQSVLAQLAQFVSINSIIEIDLTGQVNAEMLAGEQISGGGGMSDFVLGARINSGGKSILATTASARAGQSGEIVSRIVCQLSAGSAVTIPRYEVDCVATEFGLVQLKHLSIDERAAALISIADPMFQEMLARQWRKLRSTL